jgi:hypothetical protein
MSNKRIERLRDKLMERGQRGQPTLHQFQGRHPTVMSPELSALAQRVRPFAEVMYLVLVADREITDRERDLLRGAMRSLTDGALSTPAMSSMMDEFEHCRTRDGVDLRLDLLASVLYPDRADARLALGLATVAAEADHSFGAEKRALIDGLGERLGISRREVQEMLQGAPS